MAKEKRGFTLIEMMLVLTIVMGLMTLELKRKALEISEFRRRRREGTPRGWPTR